MYEKCGIDTAITNGVEVTVYPGFDERTTELLNAKPFMYHDKTRMVAQIHDEVITEIKDDVELVSTYAQWQKDVMEIPPLKDFPVQLEAEASVAYSWGNKLSFDAYVEIKKGGK